MAQNYYYIDCSFSNVVDQEVAIAQSDRLCPDCGNIIKKGDRYHRRYNRKHPLRICLSCHKKRGDEWRSAREKSKEQIKEKKDRLIDALQNGPRQKSELEKIVGGDVRDILRRLTVDGYNIIEDSRMGTPRNPLISLGKLEKANPPEIMDYLQTMATDEFQYVSLKNEIIETAARSAVSYIFSACCKINVNEKYISCNDRAYEYEFLINSEWSDNPNKIEFALSGVNFILRMQESEGFFIIKNFDDVFRILDNDRYESALFMLRFLLKEGI